MRGAVAALTGLTLMVQAAAPAGVLADNPFARVPGPGQDAAASATAAPARPTPLLPPQAPGVGIGIAATIPAAPTPVPGRAALSPFERTVEDYIAAYYSGNPRDAARAAKRVSGEVFARAGTPEYEAGLRSLDARAPEAPEAIYDLARKLQLRWESLYTPHLSALRLDRVRTGTKAGLVIGLVAYGALMWRRPAAVPRYFSLWRKVMAVFAIQTVPALGAETGAHVGAALSGGPGERRSFPPAPALFMRLGITQDDYPYDHNQLIAEIGPLAGAAAAGAATYRLVRILQLGAAATRVAAVATAPADVVPPVLVASVIAFAASIAVEKAAVAGIDAYELGRFRGHVLSARDLIDRSVAESDDLDLFRAADALVATSKNLSHYLNREAEEAKEELLKDSAKAAERYGAGSERYQLEINELLDRANEAIREAAAKREVRADEDYQAILALGFLAEHDHDAVASLGEAARARAEECLKAFAAWQERPENTELNTSLEGFRAFVAGLKAEKERQLALKLKEGDLSRHPNLVLLQAAAYIRGTGNEFIEDRADELMALVHRNELIARNASVALEEATEPRTRN